MRVTWIVYRKELQEILRDRRTLLAIGLAALATPLVLFVISQVSTKTATQTYTVGYSGEIPTGLDILLRAASLKFVPVPDPAAAAKSEVDLGVAFLPGEIDEYYDPSRQGAQIADVRLQTVLGQYQAAQAAAALQSRGIDPGILTPLKFVSHPLSSPVQAASNAFLSFFLPYILITMILTGGFSAALDSSAGERERHVVGVCCIACGDARECPSVTHWGRPVARSGSYSPRCPLAQSPGLSHRTRSPPSRAPHGPVPRANKCRLSAAGDRRRVQPQSRCA